MKMSSYSTQEVNDCILELVKHFGLDVDNNRTESEDLWTSVTSAFNKASGANDMMVTLRSPHFFSLGLAYSVSELKTKVKLLKSASNFKGDPRLKCSLEEQRTRADEAREKAEIMRAKADEAKKIRHELEAQVLRAQLERENFLTELAKLQKVEYEQGQQGAVVGLAEDLPC